MKKHFDFVANGRQPIVGASVRVTQYPGGQLAAIYSENGSTPRDNPMTTDSNGYFEFYAADGRYTITISGTGFQTRIVKDVLIEDQLQVSTDVALLKAQVAALIAGTPAPTPAPTPSPTPTPTPTPTPAPSSGVFAAAVTVAPANSTTVSGLIHLRIEGTSIYNAELLPGSGSYTPVYGTFNIASDHTWAELDIDSNELPAGAHSFRIAAYDKAPGTPGAVEITAMTSRTWTVQAGTGQSGGVYPAISGPSASLFAAQPTFFDGFDGSSLSGRWNRGIFYEDGVPANTMRVTNSRLDLCTQSDSMTLTGSNTSYVCVDTDPDSGVSPSNKASSGFSQKYGSFQARMKLPAGKGYWASFWLFNHVGNGRPEIDVFESYAGGSGDWSDGSTAPRPMRADVTVHPLTTNGYAVDPANFSIAEGIDLSAAFHDYTCVWAEDYMDFYFDGAFVQRVDDPAAMEWFAQFELYILFSFGLGSAAGNRSANTSVSPVGFGSDPANPPRNVFSIEYVMAHQFL